MADSNEPDGTTLDYSRGSHLLTPELAERAVHIVLDNLFHQLRQKPDILNCPHLHVVVIDPTEPLDLLDDGNILYEYSIGDEEDWQYDFKGIAHQKAYATWRYGMPTQVISEQRPWMLTGEDTPYFGSAYRDGIIVAASGVQPWFDQMFSEMIASVIAALCFDEMRKPGGIMSRDDEGFRMDTETEKKLRIEDAKARGEHLGD